MRRFRVVRSLTLEAPGGRLDAAVAESFGERLLGLAGCAGLEPGRALLIPRCCSIHTVGMRFPIDVAFLAWPPAPRCPVLAVDEAVGAMRISRLRGRGGRDTAVLETPAGTLRALGVRAGTGLLVVGGGPHGRLLTSGHDRQRADRRLADLHGRVPLRAARAASHARAG